MTEDGDTKSKESHIHWDPDTRSLVIETFGIEAIRLQIPSPHGKTKRDFVEMFMRSGLRGSNFRDGVLRGMAAAYWDVQLGSRPCTPSRCFCTKEDMNNARQEQCESCRSPDGCDRCLWCCWDKIRTYEHLEGALNSATPDLWVLIPEHKLLVVVDCDVESPPRKYTNLWWWLDCESWSMCEIRVDRSGTPISTTDHWSEHCNEIKEDLKRERITRARALKAARGEQSEPAGRIVTIRISAVYADGSEATLHSCSAPQPGDYHEINFESHNEQWGLLINRGPIPQIDTPPESANDSDFTMADFRKARRARQRIDGAPF